uniref:Uncharacterized protein n=1 Tax=Anopheles atroparvus TaxID=41427 RepID=A0A182J0L9_ANOAO
MFFSIVPSCQTTVAVLYTTSASVTTSSPADGNRSLPPASCRRFSLRTRFAIRGDFRGLLEAFDVAEQDDAAPSDCSPSSSVSHPSSLLSLRPEWARSLRTDSFPPESLSFADAFPLPRFPSSRGAGGLAILLADCVCFASSISRYREVISFRQALFAQITSVSSSFSIHDSNMFSFFSRFRSSPVTYSGGCWIPLITSDSFCSRSASLDTLHCQCTVTPCSSTDWTVNLRSCMKFLRLSFISLDVVSHLPLTFSSLSSPLFVIPAAVVGAVLLGTGFRSIQLLGPGRLAARRWSVRVKELRRWP